MNIFSSVFSKVVATFISIICAFSFITPNSYKKPVSRIEIPIVEQQAENNSNSSEYTELVDDEKAKAEASEDAVKDMDVEENSLNDNASAESQQDKIIEKRGNYELEKLETIDISATESDDVTLTIYAAPKRAGKVTVDKTSIGAVDENGNTQTYVTAVISGDGDMEENVYRHFVSVEKYINTVKRLMAEAYGLNADDVKYDLPEGVTDLMDVDRQIAYYTDVDCEYGPAGTYLPITDGVRAAFNPVDILEYSPNNIYFDGNITSISNGAFLCCDDLTEITIPGSVETIGVNAFSYCSNLREVYIEDGVNRIEEVAFFQCRNLEKVELPATINYIGREAFAFIKEDSRIICPTNDVYMLVNADDVVTPGRTVAEYKAPVERRGNYELEKLETIDISATEGDDVTLTIYAAPKRAGKVTVDKTSIGTIDENGDSQTYVTAVVSGEGNMEENVYRHFVDVDKFINNTCALMAKEYGLNADDVKYDLPAGVTDLLDVDEQIAYYTVADCEYGPAGTYLPITDGVRDAIKPADMLKYSPTEIYFNGNITSISDGAFLFCYNLVSVHIPGSVETIGVNAFSYCSNLTEVYMEDGVKRIEELAFFQCRNLEEIQLPATVNYIGRGAFECIKADSRILCPTENVYMLANGYEVVTPGRTTVEYVEVA